MFEKAATYRRSMQPGRVTWPDDMNKISANSNTGVLSPRTDAGKAFFKPGNQMGEQGFDLLSGQGVDGLSFGGAGFDLTQVPVRPGLHTGTQVQCCAKDGEDCSCPKCRKAADADKYEAMNGEEEGAVSEPDAEQSEVSETSPSTESPEAATKTPEATASGLIVEDSAEEVQEGQMKKTPFLQQLREAICSAIGPVLAKKDQTTDGCPYLNHWFDTYQGKDAASIEQTLKRYAPDTVNAKTAEDIISIVAQRALRAAEAWVSNGQLPEGLPTALPDEPSSPEASDNEEQGAAVQAKAKSGGVKRGNDPHAIQQELGEGQPLAWDVRGRMESAFGMNFSHVRTHTDATATEASNRVNARAFTVGNHVAFGNGEYQPGTMMGDALIAHELAHTVQQGGSGGSVDKSLGGSVLQQIEPKKQDQ